MIKKTYDLCSSLRPSPAGKSSRRFGRRYSGRNCRLAACSFGCSRGRNSFRRRPAGSRSPAGRQHRRSSRAQSPGHAIQSRGAAETHSRLR